MNSITTRAVEILENVDNDTTIFELTSIQIIALLYVTFLGQLIHAAESKGDQQ
ncbi:hypothetical protein [Natronococcus occultus]|uniref:Uncharacterized protein n=1 Tax=Natronococcus occultus SP4 TaxID=694430 RepID=L0K1R4_9EURY|nr:hypothetical protein [Natronococcus occultus]AGB38058.1 hypothetical protein Natoc_2280 [Natronococcus occultus SP4]